MTSTKSLRQQLRERMRSERRQLASDTREWAAAELCKRVIDTDHYLAATRIAVYLAFDGELDTGPLIAHARGAGKTVHLPVVQPGSMLSFAPYHEQTPLVPNRYNIPEPECDTDNLLSARQLDLIFMPLVAFDYSLHRLGMGKGYYDRTMAPLRDSDDAGPLLVGLAYDLQCAETVWPQQWDIAAHCIYTEACVYRPE